MTDVITDIIKKYEEPGDFTYAKVSNEQIDTVAKNLNITAIPLLFKDFLMLYGHGGIGGIEILGFGKNGKAIFESETLKFREYGLPMNLIVLENCDEWIYCIDYQSGEIVSWSNTNIEHAYPDFDAYLLDRFKDASENI